MLDRPRSVIDVFNDSCARYADKPAFTGLGKTLSYRDFGLLSDNFASYLQNHTPLKPGDRIAIQLPNLLQYPVAVFGALRAGLIIVNINPLYTAREIEHQLCDSGAKALVVLANIADTAAKIIHNTCVETVIVTQIADLHSPPKRLLINSTVKYIKKMVPSFHYPNQINFVDVIAKGRVTSYQSVSTAPEETAVLQYTGGTTGVAKGVMLSHQNLVANMEQVKGIIDQPKGIKNGVYVAPLPLYHIYAFTVHCMCFFNRGDHNLLIANPRDIPAFVKALKKHTIVGMVGVNTLFSALCRDKDFAALDFSQLHLTTSGGMALTQSVSEQWEKVTGTQICEGFGLTEASPLVAINPSGANKPGTVGVPLANTEVNAARWIAIASLEETIQRLSAQQGFMTQPLR
ncbi:MAG: AMP-binding protein, partial [Spongiibacteraceae bacterium]|nr:AMP-binding protein [Spongiibacteraceae bacterium]